jgi:aspartyl/asparaginyl beta-hydroxylase (cupin superfamily)
LESLGNIDNRLDQLTQLKILIASENHVGYSIDKVFSEKIEKYVKMFDIREPNEKLLQIILKAVLLCIMEHPKTHFSKRLNKNQKDELIVMGKLITMFFTQNSKLDLNFSIHKNMENGR